MKFNDKFKIASKHIKENKTSTFLTIVIVLILSFLIMGVMITGILFKESIVKTYKDFTISNKITFNIFTQKAFEDSNIELIEKCASETINQYNYDFNVANDKHSIYISYLPTLSDNADDIIFDFNKAYNQLKTIVPTIKTSYGIMQNVTCPALDSLNRVKSISTIILFLIIMSGLITLISTIGTIINSILISIDQNKSSYGILKALGANKKDTFGIVIIEIFITIILGVLISAILLLLLNKTLILLSMYLVKMTISIAMDGFYGSIIAPSSIPFYIPLATILLMMFFIVLFARINLNTAISTSPLEIISEVNHHEN